MQISPDKPPGNFLIVVSLLSVLSISGADSSLAAAVGQPFLIPDT